MPLHQPFRAGADVVKRFADYDEIVATGGSDAEALTLAVEEPGAELRFQCLHLLADRALSHVKLFRGPSKALVACGRFKRPERIQRR